MSSYDSVYRIDAGGNVHTMSSRFGRPQGLAFDPSGSLYIVDALAGASGVYRLHPDGSADQVLAGSGLIGLAFDPTGGLVVCSNETVYRLEIRT
jgi:sugar lactone lactonase YvrE